MKLEWKYLSIIELKANKSAAPPRDVPEGRFSAGQSLLLSLSQIRVADLAVIDSQLPALAVQLGPKRFN